MNTHAAHCWANKIARLFYCYPLLLHIFAFRLGRCSTVKIGSKRDKLLLKTMRILRAGLNQKFGSFFIYATFFPDPRHTRSCACWHRTQTRDFLSCRAGERITLPIWLVVFLLPSYPLFTSFSELLARILKSKLASSLRLWKIIWNFFWENKKAPTDRLPSLKIYLSEPLDFSA